MSEILTTASTVQCAHGGKVSLTGTPKLKVAGEKAILKSETSGWTVSTTCGVQTDPNPGTIKCSLVLSITAGEAIKLTVGGVAVMLGTTTGVTNGVPPPPPGTNIISASAEQTKLSAS